MLIAALCADGVTEIGNIRQIDRGYERIDERLRASRGADRAGGRRARRSPEHRRRSGYRRPMVDRIPSGTRDVLPDEMRELRAMTDRIRGVFERRRLRRGVHARARVREHVRARRQRRRQRRVGDRPAYRMFDEQGNVLVLRPDMTIPIARLVATRYAHAEPPLRFCYFAHAYRGVRPQRGPVARAAAGRGRADRLRGAGGHRRGADGPLRGARRRRARDLPRRPGRRLAVPGAARGARVPEEVARADPERAGRRRLRRGRERDQRRSGCRLRTPSCCSASRRRAVAPRCSTASRGPLEDAATGMRAVHALLPPQVAERIIFDLGLVRSLGYYTGAVFQVYDPALRRPDRQRRALRRAAGRIRPPAARGRVRARRRAAAHRADRRGAGPAGGRR